MKEKMKIILSVLLLLSTASCQENIPASEVSASLSSVLSSEAAASEVSPSSLAERWVETPGGKTYKVLEHTFAGMMLEGLPYTMINVQSFRAHIRRFRSR